MNDSPPPRELEWATDTSSTAPDLDGHGRILDNAFSSFLRRIGVELPPNHSPYTLHLPPRLSEASFVTDSDAITIPDNPGPGHTVDRFLTWGGEPVERLAAWLSRRTGRHPAIFIGHIVTGILAALQGSCKPQQCPWCSCQYVPTPPRPPSSTKDFSPVCDWLLEVMTWSPRCAFCRQTLFGWSPIITIPEDASRKLVRMLRSSNRSSRDISLQFLTLLAATVPTSRVTLAQINTGDALNRLYNSLLDRLQVDHILASSRRALYAIHDVKVLSLSQCMEAEYSMYSVGGPKQQRLSVLEETFLKALRDPIRQAFTLTVFLRLLTKSIHWINLDLSHKGTCCQLWIDAATSTDPAQVAVLSDFLVSLYHDPKYYQIDHTKILDSLMYFLRVHTDLAEKLPPRLQELVRQLPNQYQQEALETEKDYGRPVNDWKRTIWRYNKDDPDGEPDDDWRFYWLAGDEGFERVDEVWTAKPPWETCERRAAFLQSATTRVEEGDSARNGRKRQEARSQSMPPPSHRDRHVDRRTTGLLRKTSETAVAQAGENLSIHKPRGKHTTHLSHKQGRT